MKGSNKAVSYVRAPETRGKRAAYEEKFAGLIQLCGRAEAEGFQNVIVNWPWTIGDTYEEVIESLSRIAEAGLVLHIVDRGDNKHIVPPGIDHN